MIYGTVWWYLASLGSTGWSREGGRWVWRTICGTAKRPPVPSSNFVLIYMNELLITKTHRLYHICVYRQTTTYINIRHTRTYTPHTHSFKVVGFVKYIIECIGTGCIHIVLHEGEAFTYSISNYTHAITPYTEHRWDYTSYGIFFNFCWYVITKPAIPCQVGHTMKIWKTYKGIISHSLIYSDMWSMALNQSNKYDSDSRNRLRVFYPYLR